MCLVSCLWCGIATTYEYWWHPQQGWRQLIIFGWPSCINTSLAPTAAVPCKCHGNHEDFVIKRDGALLWDLTFNEWEWENVFRSMTSKARGRLCDPTIVQALEVAEKRLTMFGAWYNNPELWKKLRRLGINWRRAQKKKAASLLRAAGLSEVR